MTGIKILHVLPSPRAEGTPRLVLDWLSVKGYDQELLFLSPKGELRDVFEATGVWQYYNTDFEPRFKSAALIIALVQRICKDRKPDVVISWPLGFSHWIAWGARRAGIRKNIAHAGNPAGSSFMAKYVHSWISFTIGRLNGNIVIACSDYVMNSFKRIPLVSSKNIFSVYNCAQIGRFIVNSNEPTSSRKRDFIMVATLEPHKDHATLLKAWKIAQGELQDSHLLIVGDGTLRPSLEALALELALKNVHFMGSRKNIPELLHQASYFVLSTTRQEGFGTVLIEALAAGCQIIATDVPACREVLQGGQLGMMIPLADPETLAAGMVRTYGTTLSEERVTRQISYVLGFSPEAMMLKYLTLADLRVNK